MHLASITENLKELFIGLGPLYLIIVTIGVLITPLLFIYILISLKDRTKGENILSLAFLVIFFAVSTQLYDSAENAHNLAKEQLAIDTPALTKTTVTFSPEPSPTSTPKISPTTTNAKEPTNTPSPIPKNNEPLITEKTTSTILLIIGGIVGLIALVYAIKLASSLAISSHNKRKEKKARKADNARRYAQQKTLFEQLEATYTQTETSKETLLYLPIMLDVTYPETAAFHREFNQARRELEIATDNVNKNLLVDTEKLEKEIEQAQIAWDNLLAKATQIGFPKIEGRQARLLQKHLDTVLDEAVTDEERKRNLEALTRILEDVKAKLSADKELGLVHVVQEIQKRAQRSEGLGKIASSEKLALTYSRLT